MTTPVSKRPIECALMENPVADSIRLAHRRSRTLVKLGNSAIWLSKASVRLVQDARQRSWIRPGENIDPMAVRKFDRPQVHDLKSGINRLLHRREAPVPAKLFGQSPTLRAEVGGAAGDRPSATRHGWSCPLDVLRGGCRLSRCSTFTTFDCSLAR
jgi:hypothetical protein